MMRWTGAAIAMILALSLSWLAGESPLTVSRILFESAFGSMYDFGLTLFYATPLIFCGLSVAVAFHAGLFNIGAEGQLLMAAAAATATGVLLPQVPPAIAPWLAIVVGLTAGALWGALSGWLKAVRGSHEVITTILLNFIAAGLTSWFILGRIPNPDSQNPESAMIAPQYQLKSVDLLVSFFPDSGVNFSLFVALISAVALWFVLFKTRWGFELRAVGFNPEAAERGGISIRRKQIEAMAIAGVLAGGVAISEVIGHSGQFKIGFSPDYGFIGIAVALLARNHPLGILAAAFFMASLHKGASALDFETDTVTRDFSKILQAMIILGVGVRLLPKWRLPWKS